MTEYRLKGQMLDPGFIRRPDEVGTMPHSSKEEMETALAELQANKEAWVKLDLRERLAILGKVQEDLRAIASQWVAVSIEAKGTRGNAYAEAEEWAMFATVLRNVRLLPGPVTTRRNGQIVAQVFPQSWFDRLMLPGTTAEVWMQPGFTFDEIRSSQARFYQNRESSGTLVLVLGAGNASMLVPTDFLYKLFVEGQVVILKPNPVNAYLGPVLERGFHSLIESGFLRIVYGGVE
jgi:hypothetical protein